MLWEGQTLGVAPWFINFNYQVQEISSSVLGVLVAALTKGMTVEHALLLVKLVGLTASITTLLVLWLQREILFVGIPNTVLLSLAVIVSTATSPCFQYWTFGGLETPYYTLLLVVFCLILVRSLSCNERKTKVDLGLLMVGIFLFMARTEGFWPILLAGVFCIVMVRCISIRKSTVRAIVIAIAFFTVFTLFRIAFTGVPWPNPVYAKVGDLTKAIPIGFRYLLDYYKSSPWGLIQGLALFYGLGSLFRLGICIFKRVPPSKSLILEAVISATLFCHQTFIILTGGNWMEYFRFEVVIIPLQNILVFRMVGKTVKHVIKADRQMILRQEIFLSIMLLSFLQIGRAGNLYAGNNAKPLQEKVWVKGIDCICRYLILGNGAYSRDWIELKPFLDNKLPELLRESGGHIIAASPQAGFFPYFLRQKYSPAKVWFIDSMGLTDLSVASLPGSKSNVGNFDGNRIDLALEGKSGALSKYLEKHPPNLVYLLSADEVIRNNFSALGYRIVWDEHNAVVFFRLYPHNDNLSN